MGDFLLMLTMIPLQFQQLKRRGVGGQKIYIQNRDESRTLVVSGTAPLTTLTISLSRYLGINSAKRLLHAGVCSEGLRSMVHPAAIAPAFLSKSNE